MPVPASAMRLRALTVVPPIVLSKVGPSGSAMITPDLVESIRKDIAAIGSSPRRVAIVDVDVDVDVEVIPDNDTLECGEFPTNRSITVVPVKSVPMKFP